MFFYHLRDKHGNVMREVYKMITDVCPHCISVLSHQKPTMGIKNIFLLMEWGFMGRST
jgi:hypothetical protein